MAWLLWALIIFCSCYTNSGLRFQNINVGFVGETFKKKICSPDPEVCMNASQLITSKGYPCEEHTVKTQDGFLLGLQRIPHGRHQNGTSSKGVVFLQHGLLASSTNWLTNLENQSLAYILADAGFDVWLGNVRGNFYSREHVRYKPTDAEFWAWSWDEMAMYDLPAMVDFALSRSGQKQLYYVGHSQGTLIMFAHLAENPDFAQKIRLFFALGPVATVGHIEGPMKVVSYLSSEIVDLFKIFGVHEFLPKNEIIQLLGATFCTAFTRVICEDILFLFAGFDRAQLNATRLPVYLSHTPAGTSVQNMVKYAQGVHSGRFQKYDYGSEEANLHHYGQRTPPIYDPSRIRAPIALFSAQDDWLADPMDVSLLKPQLSSLVYDWEVPVWDHLDFIWAMDAAELVYSKILRMMEYY